MTSNEIFVDGIADIVFSNGAIRMDYYTLVPNEADPTGQTPKREFRQRVIMTPRGFLDTFAALQGMINKLEENNVISRTPSPGVHAKGNFSDS